MLNSTLHTDTMTIIGIDPGYDRCGFAVLEQTPDSDDTLLYSDCLQTSSRQPFIERLHAVGTELVRLIETYTATTCAIEKVYFSNNQKTAMQVSEVRGTLLYLSHTHGLQTLEYTPNEIKVAIAGDGHADKKQVIFMVPRLVTIAKEVRFDDEYDAIATALTASACSRRH